MILAGHRFVSVAIIFIAWTALKPWSGKYALYAPNRLIALTW